MFKNYLNTAWRNLLKNKTSSFINISGLAVGMAAALVIGLWIWGELSFDRTNKNYDRIARVMQNLQLNNTTQTWDGVPYPLAEALRSDYKEDFKMVTLLGRANSILLYNNQPFSQDGLFLEPQGKSLLDLAITGGSTTALNDPRTVMLSQSAARLIFGDASPLNKTIRIENIPVKVGAVYKDLPINSTFAGRNFIAPWDLKLETAAWIKNMDNPWGLSGFEVYVQLADNASLKAVSAKIGDEKLTHIRESERDAKPQLFLHPMRDWHLRSEFTNGVNSGGAIKYLWWFGIIGAFILFLACINFVNLSTARSEKRAKEVGVRKTIGSLRRQLIHQFLTESIVTALCACLIALVIAQLALPFFNNLTARDIRLPISNIYCWSLLIGFALFTGACAGIYPAFYLSAFNPVLVLKGAIRSARFSALPRKILVVVQFSISVILIIGTLVVYRQVQFAKDRPLGYDQNGLISVSMHNFDIKGHFAAIENDLRKSGAIVQMAESGNAVTEVNNSIGGLQWKGKPADLQVDLPLLAVSHNYGNTVGWQIIDGRDFSKEHPADSAAFILNESAVRYMGFKDPIGEKVAFDDGVAFAIVGVVKDFVMESPYEPVRPSLFRLVRHNGGLLNLKLNPQMSAATALARAAEVFKTYNPEQPFQYQFADEAFAQKFADEQKLGILATSFATLAIFISCLGLFGLTSFVAEQRRKEIGVRKVLGASVYSVWQLLSKEFMVLILVSLCIALPLGYYFMQSWLQSYVYRVPLSWWIFAGAALGAVLVTLSTISFQSVKAAIARPVQSLRSE